MRVEPYLYFNGRCEEAVTFYQKAVGAVVVALTRFKEVPGAPAPKGDGSMVMHADLRVGETTVLASDGQSQGPTDFRGFSLSLTVAKNEEADRLFRALGEGGRVQLPLTATPFASRFGMVADRFGVLWTIAAHEAGASADA